MDGEMYAEVDGWIDLEVKRWTDLWMAKEVYRERDGWTERFIIEVDGERIDC